MLAAIRTATESMKTAADKGEWVSVAEQEQSRLGLIQEFFSVDQVSREDAALARETINFILDVDKEILSKAVEAKNLIHGESQQLSKEKRAFEAYNKK